MSTVRIQVRRGLASEWTTANPVLAAGEMGVETNTNKFKFGNGSSTWTALSYAAADTAAIGEISQDAIDQALSMGAGLTKTYNDGTNTITITVDTDVISTKAFATSEATSKASAAQTAAIAAAATDATTKANAAQAAAATDATTKANAALAAAEDYTDTAISGVNNSLGDYIPVSDRGAQNGVASLDTNTKIPVAQIALNNFDGVISTSANIFGNTITGTNLVAEDLLTANDVNITGNLTVSGTSTTVNSTNVSYDDPMIYIGDGNQSNVLDVGVVGAFNNGTYQHTGLVRDASDGIWKLFSGVVTEPTTTVDFTTYTRSPLEVGQIFATAAQIGEVSPQQVQMLSDVTGPIQSQLDTKLDEVPNLSVTTAKITDDAVTASKIAESSVTEVKIANSAVTAAKIASSSVTEVKIANDAVSEDKIFAGAVTADKIRASAVTETKIANDAVTGIKIANDAVNADKIVAGSVTTDKIENNSVTEIKIANSAVTINKIADATITNAKISATAEIDQSKVAGLTQALDAKAPIDSPTLTGAVVLPASTTIGLVDSTEIGYLNGVTSSIQTQITAAATELSNHEADTTNIHGIADTSLLATKSYADTAEADAITAAGTAADSKVAAAVAALTKSSVGLANVDNTSDASKPVSTAQASAIATAKSEAIADATAQVNAVIAAAPAALNTLDELAAALGDDANFATTVTTSLASKAPIASPTFTGTVTVAAAGVAFTDGTQTKEGVPSRTVIGTAIAGAYNLSTGGLALRDQLIPVSGAHTITVPTNATTAYPIGTSISFYQSAGADAVFAEASGVTILRTPGLKLRALYSSATITKVATDTWLLAGDLKA
jgi:hypothetical protein